MTPRNFVNKKVKELPPSGIRKFFDLVVNTKGVISLGVGEPDFVTPWHIREACVYSLEKGYTMYTSNYGLLELRQEIAKHFVNKYKLEYNPEGEIVITVGVSEALDIVLRAVLEEGEEVLIPEPSFVSYKPCTTLAGGVPIPIETTVATEFKLTPDMLRNKITPKTKAVLLSYPNNPTGTTYTKAELLELAKVIEQYDLLVLSDEIYADLTYEGSHTCFASLPNMKERTVVFNGFSKAYAMTGWRIGYTLANKEITDAIIKIHQYAIMCAPVMGQMAALEALKNGEEEVKYMVNQYNKRRRLIVSRFNEIGLECHEPNGAFYAFPSVKSTGFTAEEFCEKLLLEEKVAVVPGNAFGVGGDGHIRCTYASSLENITEALKRMEKFVRLHCR
ncbi:MAG: aminotransferase class I/II-fold pyridoxal phosphate-dependent enzyme [Clostridia bacterium]|jgi:aminotransferase|nr:aminotransferase class I/II-fold pyridoxal phosphate-dependent enzyme [Clostridia bacterium]